MAAITWQNITGASLADASRPLEVAQRSLANAFTGLEDIFKKRELIDTQNFEQSKINKRDAIYNTLYGAKTSEDMAALDSSGAFGQMMTGQIADREKVQNAIDGRRGVLQDRDLTNLAYQNTLRDNKNLPIRDAIKVAILNGDAATRDTLIAANPGLPDMASLVQLTNTEQNARTAREYAAKAEGRAVDSNDRSERDLVSNIAHRTEQERVARITAENTRRALVEQVNARTSAGNTALVNARARLLEGESQLVAATGKEISEQEKKLKFGINFGEANRDQILETAKTLNKGDTDYGTSVLTKLDDYQKKIGGADIPVAIIKSALSRASNDTFNVFNSNRGYGRAVVDYVKEEMANPRNIADMAEAKVQLANIQKQYGGGVLPGAVPVAPPAVENRPQPLPPKLQPPPPPEVARSGALVYKTPGALNISSNQGVMLPAKMPTGALEATINDGDTMHVKGDNGVAVDIRFGGFDAQETSKTVGGNTSKGQKFSEAARDFVTEAMKKGKVEIKINSNKPDKYGRLIGDDYVNGENIREMLSENGLATALDLGVGPRTNDALKRLQSEAMRKSLGMFGDMGSSNTLTGAAYRRFGDTLYTQ